MRVHAAPAVAREPEPTEAVCGSHFRQESGRASRHATSGVRFGTRRQARLHARSFPTRGAALWSPVLELEWASTLHTAPPTDDPAEYVRVPDPYATTSIKLERSEFLAFFRYWRIGGGGGRSSTPWQALEPGEIQHLPAPTAD